MLKEVLDEFEKKHQVHFAYDDNLVNNIPVNISLANLSLDQVLKEHDLSVHKVDELLIVKRIPTSSNKPSQLNGVIKDDDSGKCIPNVYINYADELTVSDYKGRFNINSYIVGKGDIKVSHLGYQHKYTLVKSDSSDSFVEIKLHSKPELLNEVVIEERPEMITLTDQPGKLIIEPENLDPVPGIGENDLMRALQLMPGVQGVNQSSSGLSIRGSAPLQNLIMLDGFTIFRQDHLFGWLSAINSNTIQEVQLYKSGFGAKYGGRSSAVLDITGKSGSTTDKGVKGKVSVNSFNINITGSTNIGNKASLFVGVRRSYTDFAQSPLFNKIFTREQNAFLGENSIDKNEKVRTKSTTMPNQDYLNTSLSPSKYRFGDMYAKLTLHPNTKNKLALSYYISKDQLNSTIREGNATPSLVDNSYWGNKGIGLVWEKEWSSNFLSSYSVGVSDYFFNYNSQMLLMDERNTDFDRKNNYSQNLKEVNLRLNHNWQMSSMHALDFGLFATSNYLTDNESEYISNIKYSSETQANVLGSYVQYQSEISSKLTLTTGVRNSYYLPLKKFFTEPRVEITHQANKYFMLKGSFGRYNQFLNYKESLNQAATVSSWILADDDKVPVLLSKQYSAGVLVTKNNWLLDAEFYIKNNQGIGLSPSPTNTILFLPDNQDQINSGISQTTGMDLMIKTTEKRYQGWVSYTLSKSTMQFIYFNKGREIPALLDQRHRISLFNSYNIGNWKFSTTWHYGSGLPYYVPEESGNLSKDLKSLRLPSTHQLNLSVNYSFNIGKAAKSKLGLSIINMYNQVNVLSRVVSKSATPTDQGLLKSSTTNDVLSIGFTPTLQWQVSF